MAAESFDALVDLIHQITPVDVAAETLSRDSSLTTDLMLDSISLISLVALTEERFGVSFAGHTEAVANLATIGEALDLIALLKAGATH
ncbi:acyl carrier protein [Variovorax sp. J22R133]|uniref:acyl carrier protein n=1 Tax=Variovorax brevis TaxID=3053503 RepID=UPI0025766F11|nr:acyl carrier protein [Variovorax sp. J22R133]MDM0116492.1 acyl carrier protein [Variovorax sp. J22R133]